MRIRTAGWSAIALVACTRPSAETPGDASTGMDDAGTTSTAPTGSTTDGDSTAGDSGEAPWVWPDETLADWVDPWIGTGGVGYRVGTTNPGASVPFGMIKPGPDTGLGALQLSYLNCTGYHYDQTHVWGFSHSRINGMGVPDYGAVLVMPTTAVDADTIVRGGARSLFDHAREETRAGYYAVDLLDTGVRAELTATTRVALHRYTWSGDTDDAAIVFDLGYGPADMHSPASSVEIDAAAGLVRGMTTVAGGYSDRFGGVPTYFVARSSSPIAGFGVWDDAGTMQGGTATMVGGDIGAWIEPSLQANAPVELALAISYVSLEQAEANLAAEADGVDFDTARAAAQAAWEIELARVRVAGGTDAERTMLYTALYHSFLAPTTFSEADGSYRGFDGEVHPGEDGFTYSSDFSLWDTYRTLHPLLDLVQRDRSGDMMQSLVLMAEQGGDLPKWPLAFGYTGGMVGTSADIVLADAYLLGIEGFDAESGYAAARLHATEPRPNDGRPDIEGYLERGWVASDVAGSSASHTLELAFADHALGRWAAAMGNDADAAMFAEHAQSWENLWEPGVGYLIGRRADGTFETEGFDPLVWRDEYAEGTAWHYLWMVPHDVHGLAELAGGEAVLRERLAEYMETSADFLDSPAFNPNVQVPYYWHANEPSLHDVYLFTDLGDPASTQKWVDWVRREHYGTTAAGLPGNDDAGTMSAWYVWSAIGLYPLPAAQRWWITAPVFERVELDMGDEAMPDRTLTIVADGAGEGMIFVAGASMNGEPLDAPVIDWARLQDGGELRIELQDSPSSFGAR